MECFHRWRSWIRPFVISIYFLILVISIPLCIIELNREDAPKHVVAWFVGGIFVLMALPISLWGILQHLIYYTQPQLQRHIVRILWMVPIYALNAWLGLRFPRAAIYLDTLRECYEAYVIYNFMSYLLLYLLTEHPDLDLLLEVKQDVKHIIPFCCLPKWNLGGDFIQRCKHGVLQYTIVRPTTTAIALICQLAGVYEEGDFNFKSAWSYIVIINNISQVWAMYCLVMFYRGTKEQLKPINPIPKFMCVKAVVFLSFWQAVVIAVLVKLGAIPVDGTWDFYHDIKDVATGLQDFLICIEMFLASIAHYFSFSHKPYMDGAEVQGHCCASFMSMWDISDVRDDVLEHVKYVGKNVKKTVSRSRENHFYTKDDRNRERIPLLQYGSEIDGTTNIPNGLQSEAFSSGTLDNSSSEVDTIVEVHHETLVKQRLDGSTVKERSNKHGGMHEKQMESDCEQGHDLLDSFESSTNAVCPGPDKFDKSVSMSLNNYFEGSVSEVDPEVFLESRPCDGAAIDEGSVSTITVLNPPEQPQEDS